MKKNALLFLMLIAGFGLNAQDTTDCALFAGFTYEVGEETISFTNTSTGEPVDVGYSWYINGYPASTDENPELSIDLFEDADWVCLEVYDSTFTCYDSTCTYIYLDGEVDDTTEVDSTDCMLFANFTYSIIGETIYFTNTSTGDEDATYSWWIDGLFSSEENPSFPTTDFEATEEACLTLYDSSLVCYDTLCMLITFEDDSLGDEVDSTECELIASFTYSVSGETIYFTNTSTGEPWDASYSWYIDGFPASTEENPEFPTSLFDGGEWVCLDIHDSTWTCFDSTCMIIYFDTDSADIDSTASIVAYESESITIFPNPVTDYLNIAWNGGTGTHQIALYGPLGQLIRMETVTLTNGSTTVSVEDLPSGMYVIHIMDEGQTNSPIMKQFIKN